MTTLTISCRQCIKGNFVSTMNLAQIQVYEKTAGKGIAILNKNIT